MASKTIFLTPCLVDVLLWTLIEVLLRNIGNLYGLWLHKTPLTNGQVQEAKSHCRKVNGTWRKLG